jgi:hypothetical protein
MYQLNKPMKQAPTNQTELFPFIPTKHFVQELPPKEQEIPRVPLRQQGSSLEDLEEIISWAIYVGWERVGIKIEKSIQKQLTDIVAKIYPKEYKVEMNPLQPIDQNFICLLISGWKHDGRQMPTPANGN